MSCMPRRNPFIFCNVYLLNYIEDYFCNRLQEIMSVIVRYKYTLFLQNLQHMEKNVPNLYGLRQELCQLGEGYSVLII